MVFLSEIRQFLSMSFRTSGLLGENQWNRKIFHFRENLEEVKMRRDDFFCIVLVSFVCDCSGIIGVV